MSKATDSRIDSNPCQKCHQEKKEKKEENKKDGIYFSQDVWSRPMLHIPSFSEEECIFKVHGGLRCTDPAAYTPWLISIGPYYWMSDLYNRPLTRHWTKDNWYNTKNLKKRYLQSFLKRVEGRMTEEEILKKLEDMEPRAIRYYGEQISMSRRQFVEMLLLDGCFVVEFVVRSKSTNGCDPILVPDWMQVQIVRDLLLLENQLPFFVLNQLYQLIIHTTEDRAPLLNLVKFTFTDVLPKLRYFSLILNEVNDQEIKHLLQVVHILCRPENKDQFPVSIGQPASIESCHIRSASELQEAGVGFKRVGNIGEYSCHDTSLFDIRFNHGVLEIPSFKLGDSTVTFFKNLIAYEQHSIDVYPKYFSDYVVFMDDLMKTDKDVRILRLNGIIINGIGDDIDVARLFKQLSRWVVYSACGYCYANVSCELIQHCNKPRNVLISKLRRDYFHSPWAGISTIAAILLLLLTATQTITSILGLHH